MAQREIASGFIYPQTRTVIAKFDNENGTNRFGKDAQKPFRILKGVDTNIQFYVKSENGKRVNLVNKSISAALIKSTDNNVIFTKELRIIDNDLGTVQLTIYASDTLLLNIGYYEVMVTVRIDTGEVVPLYVNSTYQQKYSIELLDNYIEAAPNVYTSEIFYENNNLYYTNMIASTAQNESTFGVSTIAIYGTSFTGKVGVEATLETAPAERDWFPIDIDRVTKQIRYNGFTGLDPYTFEGRFYWIRFVLEKTSGTVDKILYSC